ncbi:MAG: AMP-dependent synthetase/ligase [Rhodothermia bacterium]|nr:MAG: AMP-dependent synthetase/ligase [Rhodothermia bacterium]
MITDVDNIAKGVGESSFLGRSLPSLLYHANAVYPNDSAFVQKTETGWKPFTTDEFRRAAEETALGLLACNLGPGDRVALYLESDVYFCLVDMGCLIAGLVDVPIYLTHTQETVEYVLDHADAHGIVVSDLEKFREIRPALIRSESVHTLILVDGSDKPQEGEVPERITVTSLPDIRELGRAAIEKEPMLVRQLSDRLEPNDLATIIYTSGTTGRPKGVMLTHENISYNALSAFEGLVGYRSGREGETLLSFLPLTHVFARTNYYLALSQGSSLYFSTPDDLVRDLADVHPSMLITVPRVLEKVYARILERSGKTPGFKGRIARWGVRLSQNGDAAEKSSFWRRSKVSVADKLVYAKWRLVLGGRLKFLISGGAALSEEICQVFENAGIPILQGYGLTETSPVISFNRPGNNRPGTVGQVLNGVEVMIADDGEILTRGPHVMAGYFRDEQLTKDVISEENWFYTGDIGTLTDDGFLTITDRKKDLFKLSTGKYVVPQPLENKMSASPLIEQAVVVGAGYRYATALIFPDESAVLSLADTFRIKSRTNFHGLLEEAKIVAAFQKLVDRANDGVAHWSTINKFVLIPDVATIENGLLTPTLKVRRTAINSMYADQIEAMYEGEKEENNVNMHPEVNE